MDDGDRSRERLIEELNMFRGRFVPADGSAQIPEIREGIPASERDLYRCLLDYADDVIWLYDLQSARYIYISPSVEKLHGFPVDEILSHDASFVIPPRYMGLLTEDLPVRIAAFQAGDEGLRVKTYELEVRRADGGSVPVEIMTRFISDSSGRVMFIHGITRDISGRRKAEENLLIREHQLRAILEATEESVLLVDRNERLLEINGVALRRFGLDEQTVRKGLLSDHLHPDVREGRKDNLREVLEKGRPMRFEDEREGRTIMNVYYPVIEKGRVESVAIFGKDITEEKAALKALEESRARLAEANRMLNLVINTIPVRIFWKDSALVFLGCNGLFARDAGESDPSLVTGRDDFSMPWRDQAESYRKDDMEVISSGRARINFEEEQTNSAGESIWLQTSKVPMRDQEGKIFGVLGTYEDVTEKKKLEQAIAESEDRYRSLFHNNHAILYVVDPDTGRIVDANPAACRFYGYDADTFRTMSVTDINIMKPGQIREEMERARSEERYYFIFEHRLANGEIRPVELYGGPIMIKGKKHLYSIVHDISERKKAEEDRERLIVELREALSKIKTLSGLLPICASCKKIRDDSGYWNQIECYIREHSEAEFTHSLCPDCIKKLYPGIKDI